MILRILIAIHNVVMVVKFLRRLGAYCELFDIPFTKELKRVVKLFMKLG